MRRLTGVFAALALTLPVQCWALGIGEIEWHSALNQPLDAEIELFSAEDFGPHDIVVRVAPFEEFEKVGLDYPSILSHLKFSVERNNSGELYIKVTSSQSITDPFLDILIELDWPSGHVLREYTLLLDLPVTTEEAPAPVMAPGVTTVDMSDRDAVQQESAPIEMAQTPAQPVMADRMAAVPAPMRQGELNYGMVRRGDTLWAIAERMRPNDSVSVQQMMMALLKSNPDAFYDGNVNNLKAGYVLRIDDTKQITAMSKTAAARAAQQQYQQWLAAKKLGTTAQRPLGQQAATAAADGHMADSARLRLSAPDSADLAASAARAGRDSSAKRPLSTDELESMRDELSHVLESSDAGRQENIELRDRIVQLEKQINEMQRLLSLRDDALAVMQTQTSDLATQPKPVQAPVKQVPVKPAAQPKPTPKPVAQQPADKALLDELLQDPQKLGIVGGGALLLLVLIWLLIKRRKMANSELDEQLLTEEEEVDKAAAEADAEMEDADDISVLDSLGSSSAGLDTGSTEVDEIDVLAEADVYLAYQRFDRAEELLNDAIANEPDRQDLVMKLLEVYVSSDNRDAFIERAEQFYEAVGQHDQSVWTRVVAMGKKLVGDHPLFGGAAVAVAAAGALSEDGLDAELPGGDLEADLGMLEDDDLLLDNDIDDSGADDLAGLDFDLGGADQDADEVAPGSVAESDFDLDTELDSELATDEGSLEFDTGLTMDSDEDSLETAESEAESAAEEIDSGLDFDGGLDMESDLDTETTAVEEDLVVSEDDENSLDFESALAPETDASTTDVTIAAADDSGLEFEGDSVLSVEDAAPDSAADSSSADEFSLDDSLSEESQPIVEDSGDDLDMAVADSNDDSTVDFDVDSLSETTTEKAVENVIEEDLGFDEEIEEDIDWLSTVSDEAVTDELDNALFSGDDEIATKLDLVRAYIDMGDKDSARNILNEVITDGNDEQKNEAQELMQRIS